MLLGGGTDPTLETCFTQNAQGFAGELEPPPPAFVAAAASRRPDPQPELRPEDEDGEGFLEGRREK